MLSRWTIRRRFACKDLLARLPQVCLSFAMDSCIRNAVAVAGSVKRLAEFAGVKPQAVSQWRRIPAERVRAISDRTGIPPYELRPDLWEAPAKTPAAA
jgi:DNA-binding transcriptional regulator YdaS (Cro superfamily)